MHGCCLLCHSAAWEEESMDYNGKSLHPKPLTTVAVFSFLFYRFSFLFLHKVLLCSLGWPGAYFVDQTGLEHTEIHLTLHSECWA